MKLCFITSSRADYGLIKPLIDEARSRPEIKFQLIVTGTHLSKAHGYTVDEIEKDGLPVSAQVEMLEGGDSARDTVNSMGNELKGLADMLGSLKPDMMLIPGDRYEMLAAASACLIMRIPMAHIYGGDVTEGAFDDSIRHAISKMAQVHFTSNEDSRARLIQMGEAPETVFNTGSPSLDKLATMKYLSRSELAEDLKIKFRRYNLLITFHPETLGDNQMFEFTNALGRFNDEHSLIITMPNADPGNVEIRDSLKNFAAGKDNVYLFESLGYLRYLSLMANSTMVVGNSSSGLYEAPSFKIPTINIGDRQKGRLMGESVISTLCEEKGILAAIGKAKDFDCKNIKNPYAGGGSAKKIIDVIISARPSGIKKFYDIHNR